MQVEGKVAVVTGGSSGLGQATCELLIAQGAKVAILDLNAEKGAQVASELGSNASFHQVNVASEDNVVSAIEEVRAKYSAIHINVNCAGIASAGKVVNFNRDTKEYSPASLDEFKRTIDVNLTGTFNVLRLCAYIMALNEPVTEDGERGVIVNTASVAAFDGQIGQCAYSATKGAIAAMTLPIARDLKRSGIRCCTIAPGVCNTPIFNPPEGAPKEHFEFAEHMKAQLSAAVQFPNRLGHPEEFGQLALSIITNGYLNGETIRLDGGIRMQPK